MTVTTATPELGRRFRSMATDVTLRVVGPAPGAAAALDRAVGVVDRVATTCTRFDPASPLMRANTAPRRWHQVPPELYTALRAAEAAHRATDGLFDPRVLELLTAWGYDRTLPFGAGPVALPTRGVPPRRRALSVPRPWRPQFDAARSAVRLGREPVDLGGIGKGLAVRWAAEQLTGAGEAMLVDAGGDLHALGAGPGGAGWQVAVEDPRGGAEPVAVLSLTDLACATSSVRVRRWTAGSHDLHHLVDPRTRRPANGGLLAVTVVGPDAAVAETWSKALLVAGRGRARRTADTHGVAALLVDTDGVVASTRAMRPYVGRRAGRG